jgi:stress response protein YsnF
MVTQSDDNKFGIKLSGDQIINNPEGLTNLEGDGLIKTEELVRKIPLFNEKFDVTKKTEKGNLKIEKKWITVKKKIELPLKYEEIFINGKVFDSFDEKEIGEIFSRIKSKITDVFLHERTDSEDNKQLDSTGSEIEIVGLELEGKVLNENVISEKPLALSDGTKADQNNNQQTMELWGEEIIINKKMVKLAEIVLKKYQVNEKRKVDVEVKREKLTLKFPGNFKEEIF